MANFKELDNEDFSPEIKIMLKIHERDRKRLEELSDAYALAAETLKKHSYVMAAEALIKYVEAVNSALKNQDNDKPE